MGWHASTLQRYVGSSKSQELILRLAILAMIYLWAFSIRLVRAGVGCARRVVCVCVQCQHPSHSLGHTKQHS